MADIVEIVRTNPKTAYEREDWPMRWVGIVLFGTCVFLAIAPFVLMWAYSATLSDVSRRLTAEPPAPRLQIDTRADLEKFRAGEERRLDTYYWVDRQKGVVHIPIEAAMQKLAREGFPGFPEPKK